MISWVLEQIFRWGDRWQIMTDSVWETLERSATICSSTSNNIKSLTRVSKRVKKTDFTWLNVSFCSSKTSLRIQIAWSSSASSIGMFTLSVTLLTASIDQRKLSSLGIFLSKHSFRIVNKQSPKYRYREIRAVALEPYWVRVQSPASNPTYLALGLKRLTSICRSSLLYMQCISYKILVVLA